MMRRRPRSAPPPDALAPLPKEPLNRATLRRLFGLARPYRGRLVLAGICLLVSSLLSLALPWMIQRLIDSVLVQRNPFRLGEAVLSLLAIFVVQAVFNFGYTYHIAFTGERL